MGAAYGETAAIMAETARCVVTVEHDPERVAVARERLADLANVELLRATSGSGCGGAARSGSSSWTAASGR